MEEIIGDLRSESVEKKTRRRKISAGGGGLKMGGDYKWKVERPRRGNLSRTAVEEIIRDLRLGNEEDKTRFLEDDGWRCLKVWLKRWWYTSRKKRRSPIFLILLLLKELPVASISKMFEDLEDSKIVELVEKIVEDCVKNDIGAWGTRTRKLLMELAEYWLSICNGTIRYQEKAGQTPEEIVFDPDFEMTTAFGDGKEVTFQPDVDKIWWKMTAEGWTTVVRMREECWRRLGEEENPSMKLVSAGETPTRKLEANEAGAERVTSRTSGATSISKSSGGNVELATPDNPQPLKKKKKKVSLEETGLMEKQREKSKKKKEKRVKRKEKGEDIIGDALRKKMRLEAEALKATTRDSGTMTCPSSLPTTSEFSMKKSQPVLRLPRATSTSTSWNSVPVYSLPPSHFWNKVESRSTSPHQTPPVTSVSYLPLPPSSFILNPMSTSLLVGTPQQRFLSSLDPRRASQMWAPPIAPFPRASTPKSLTPKQPTVTSEESFPPPQRRQPLKSQVFWPHSEAMAYTSFQSASQSATSMSSFQAPATVSSGFYRERSERELTSSAAASSPPQSSSPQVAKPSIRDLPLPPPESSSTRHSLVPYSDDDEDDDDVIPL